MAKAFTDDQFDAATQRALGESDPDGAIPFVMLAISGDLFTAIQVLAKHSGATPEAVLIEAVERLAIDRGINVNRSVATGANSR